MPVAAFPGGADKHFNFGGSQILPRRLLGRVGIRCLARTDRFSLFGRTNYRCAVTLIFRSLFLWKVLHPLSQPAINVVTFTVRSTDFMGRPPGRIQGRLFQMRVSDTFLRALDRWCSKQPDKPSRAEAIRRLVMEAQPPAPRHRKAPPPRPSDLPAQTTLASP